MSAALTAGQARQLGRLRRRGWTIQINGEHDDGRLDVTGTQPDGSEYAGTLTPDGRLDGQPTNPAFNGERFGIGAVSS